MNKHFRKISDYAMIGGLSAIVVGVLAGCDQIESNNASQDAKATTQAIKNGAFVILEEQADGRYKVLEEYPSATTRVVVRDRKGEERMLSDEEIQSLLRQEETRIDNGTSELTSPPQQAGEAGGSGLSLGGAILASAAGALLGSYIGNKLFNNPNYQQNKQRTYKSPQAYERSANSFNKSSTNTARTTTPNNAKSGFYGTQNPQNTQSSTNRSTSAMGS